MKLIYGTYNQAKYNNMVEKIGDLDIELINLSSLGISLIKSDENGNDPLSNAKEKALSYYRQIKRPIFSCDSGLYFRGVKESEQPGVKIRRINGKRLNDIELMEYYMNLAHKYGGKLTAYYKNAICLVLDDKNIIGYNGDDLNAEEFYIVDKAHRIMREGFPLDSISVDKASGKYYYDFEKNDKDKANEENGFYNFFKRVL